MSKLYRYLFALLVISNSTFSQGQPGEEGPPYYGLELPSYGSGREAFEAFEKEVEKRKRAQPGYVPPPYENAINVLYDAGPTFHEGVVLSYDGQSIKELKNLPLRPVRLKRSPKSSKKEPCPNQQSKNLPRESLPSPLRKTLSSHQIGGCG